MSCVLILSNSKLSTGDLPCGCMLVKVDLGTAGLAEERDCGPVSCSLLPPSLLNPLMKLQQSFVLVDPQLPDCPIVYASEEFIRLTGRPRCGNF